MHLSKTEFESIDEGGILRAVLFEYSVTKGKHYGEKAFCKLAGCSQQLLNNCKANLGHLGLERWLRIEKETGTDLYRLWEDAKRKKNERAEP